MMEQDLIIRWVADKRELYGGSLWDKALRFVDFGCIHYISDKHNFVGEGRAFVVLPLNRLSEIVFDANTYVKKPYSCDYNKTSYVITISYRRGLYEAFGDGNFFHCSCQGWHSKQKDGASFNGVDCCHALALLIYFKRKAIEKKILEELK